MRHMYATYYAQQLFFLDFHSVVFQSVNVDDVWPNEQTSHRRTSTP